MAFIFIMFIQANVSGTRQKLVNGLCEENAVRCEWAVHWCYSTGSNSEDFVFGGLTREYFFRDTCPKHFQKVGVGRLTASSRV